MNSEKDRKIYCKYFLKKAKSTQHQARNDFFPNQDQKNLIGRI